MQTLRVLVKVPALPLTVSTTALTELSWILGAFFHAAEEVGVGDGGRAFVQQHTLRQSDTRSQALPVVIYREQAQVQRLFPSFSKSIRRTGQVRSGSKAQKRRPLSV